MSRYAAISIFLLAWGQSTVAFGAAIGEPDIVYDSVVATAASTPSLFAAIPTWAWALGAATLATALVAWARWRARRLIHVGELFVRRMPARSVAQAADVKSRSGGAWISPIGHTRARTAISYRPQPQADETTSPEAVACLVPSAPPLDVPAARSRHDAVSVAAVDVVPNPRRQPPLNAAITFSGANGNGAAVPDRPNTELPYSAGVAIGAFSKMCHANSGNGDLSSSQPDDLGDVQYNIGRMFAEGKAVKLRNELMAVKWYLKAAARGHAAAAHTLWEMYAAGKKIGLDHASAWQLLQRAAHGGYEPARQALRRQQRKAG